MKKDGLYEKIKQGLKRQNTPKYDDELEKLQKEKLLLGSKENKQQDHKQNTNEQNSLQEILYGKTQGMKSFSNFRKEEKELIERRQGERSQDTIQRMEKSHQRREREKKIDKLSNNKDHWEGLQ